MRHLAPFALAAALLAATGALAQDIELEGLVQDIEPGEWQEMVLGRTVTYNIDGKVWAREFYDKTSNAVVIRLADGTCMEGTWAHVEDTYCFAWRGLGTSCFRHVRLNQQILVIPVVDGQESGNIQTVGGVSDVPVNCGPELTS